MKNKEEYIQHFHDVMLVEGYNCAQSMMLSIIYFAKNVDKNKEAEYLHLTSSLGGGVAGMHQSCGLITGAVLGYSLIYGDSEIVKEKVRKLNDLLVEYSGSWQCEKIIAGHNDDVASRRKHCSGLLGQLLAYIYDDLKDISN